MGRWRPPTPDASPYITPQGFAALQDELSALWTRRRGVVKALSAAAAEGDRSENAEYIYRKKELGSLDRRIHYLQRRLPALNVVHDAPTTDRIFFGATIELQNAARKIVRYRIVGPDEADAAKSAISMDSPLAKALLKRRVDDEVVVVTDATNVVMTVLSIRYDNGN